MGPSKCSGELKAVSEALAAWRRAFGGRGRAIPERLWAMAASVARVAGVATTARALALNGKKLGARVAALGSASSSASPAVGFIELAALPARPAQEQIVVELMGRAGDRMRIELPARGQATTELVALTRALLGGGA